ncbi:hypothetical protein RintRC_3981 [Richelia intracellularis]|nr:hypothetical protein RintRC_3981 [Richelia intracellularis]
MSLRNFFKKRKYAHSWVLTAFLELIENFDEISKLFNSPET